MRECDWLISSNELKDLHGKVELVDVREPEEFEEAHIDGCKLIPLGEIQSRGPAELDPEKEIVLYCAHGIRSVQALMALKMLGYEKLKSLDGGICDWIEHGLETRSSATQIAHSH